MFKRDWFGETLRERIPILIFTLAFLSVYGIINQYLSGKGGFVASIAAIDGNMPLLPVFVVPYVVGIPLIGLFPLFAAWKFPRDLFRRYLLGLYTVMLIGYTIWLLFPAYVVKEPIDGEGLFTNWVKMLHDGDDTYGTHNAIPSSHVYYITIAMCYYIQYDKRLVKPFILFAIVNALSTMFTHQHYFLDVLAGLLVTWVAFAVSSWWVNSRQQAKNDV